MTLKQKQSIVIKKLEISDVDSFFKLMNEPKVMEFIPDRFETYEEMSEIIEWLIDNYDKKDFIRLTYKIEYMGKFAGWISFGPLPSDETKKEIAYVIKPELWGKGIAGESVKIFIRQYIQNQFSGKIYAEVSKENFRSIKVLEKNEFKRSGIYITNEGCEKYLYVK